MSVDVEDKKAVEENGQLNNSTVGGEEPSVADPDASPYTGRLDGLVEKERSESRNLPNKSITDDGKNGSNGPVLPEMDPSQPTKFDLSSIPCELRERDQWVCWVHEEQSKIPMDPEGDGQYAKTNDPTTWSDFETAIDTAAAHESGIGFVFTKKDPFAWIDIDNCAESKELLDWCPSLDRFDSTYIEWSPSEAGLHIIFLGEVPAEFGTYDATSNGTHREIRFADCNRFTTITGALLPQASNQLEEIDLEDWVETIADESIKQTITQGGSSAGNEVSSPSEAVSNQTDPQGSHTDDGLESCYDIHSISRTQYPEEKKTTHPFHGSKTKENFKIFEGGEVWWCYRHECSGNYLHLLGMEVGVLECGNWPRNGFEDRVAAEIYTQAREAGYDIDQSADDPSESLGTAIVENSRRHYRLTQGQLDGSRDSDNSREDVYFPLINYPIDRDYLDVHLTEHTVSVDYDFGRPRLSTQGMLANPENDPLGSRTWSETEIDNNELNYPDGFAHHTPAATTFYEKESENAPNWKLHHGVDNEFEEYNERHRVDPAERDKRIYIDAVLSGLGITSEIKQRAKTTVITNDMRGFSRHYGGLVGAALGYAIYYMFDDVASAVESDFVQSSEFQQLCETHEIDPVSVIEYIFRREQSE